MDSFSRVDRPKKTTSFQRFARWKSFQKCVVCTKLDIYFFSSFFSFFLAKTVNFPINIKANFWTFRKGLTRIILRPLSALSLDKGLNALNGKTPSAAVWFRRPIKCQILERMRIIDFLYFRLQILTKQTWRMIAHLQI